MGRITLDLLRKRAEHNNGHLSDLKEIALHGQNIENIEVVGHACRELKILYLQNNVISKIIDLHHLKALEYLNLALNNITVIENLQGLESLRKLDLTMNFVPAEGLTGVSTLAALYQFTELHLLGNPCTQWTLYRPFVLAALPRLQRLVAPSSVQTHTTNLKAEALKALLPQDGEEKREEERSTGSSLEELTDALIDHIKAAAESRNKESEHLENEARTAGGEVRRSWCPETRLLEHQEHERLNEEAQKRRQDAQSQLLNAPTKKHQYRHELPPAPAEGEPILQKNEGRWNYRLEEDDTAFILHVDVGKGVDSDEVISDVHKNAVRLLLRGRLLQLALLEEVVPETSAAKRSKITGSLCIQMPKAAKSALLRQKERQEHFNKDKPGGKATEESKPMDNCETIFCWEEGCAGGDALPDL